MKRYYICDVIGDNLEEAVRPIIANYKVNWVAEIKTDPTTGLAAIPWAIVKVATNNHNILRNQPGIDPLPDFPLDGKVSAIQTATKNDMISRLVNRGIDTTFITNSDGYRDILRHLGRLLSTNFHEDAFDISE